MGISHHVFQAIEAYDVLVALLETEVAISNKDDFDLKRAAQANRRSALSVARHLIGRYDKTFRADSGIGTACSDHHGSSWEADSSGYSHTTRYLILSFHHFSLAAQHLLLQEQ